MEQARVAAERLRRTGSRDGRAVAGRWKCLCLTFIGKRKTEEGNAKTLEKIIELSSDGLAGAAAFNGDGWPNKKTGNKTARKTYAEQVAVDQSAAADRPRTTGPSGEQLDRPANNRPLTRD